MIKSNVKVKEEFAWIKTEQAKGTRSLMKHYIKDYKRHNNPCLYIKCQNGK